MNIDLLRQSILQNIEVSFCRSGGHGGQNVNKVNTKVHASLALEKIEGLTLGEMFLLESRLRNIINSNRCLVIAVQDERSQERNREIALSRLEQKICAAVKPDKPRKKSTPTRASKERRLLAKKINAAKKKSRSKFSATDTLF